VSALGSADRSVALTDEAIQPPCKRFKRVTLASHCLQGIHRIMNLLDPARSGLLVATSLWATGTADASVVRYDFTGQITTGGGTVTVGTAFSGYLIVETSPVATSGSNDASYTFQAIEVTVGSEQFSSSPGTVQVENDGSFMGDRVDADFDGGTIGGLPFSIGRFRLVDTTSQAISSPTMLLPTNLALWNRPLVIFYTPFPTSIIGEMSTLSMSVVPSPAAAPLLALAGLPGNRRRRS
jgi:hypothetical protein